MSVNNIHEWDKGEYNITTDIKKIDRTAVHSYLTRSTWAKGIDFETVSYSIDNSLNFGLFHREEQIGFARLITDHATFAYLCDVYVLEEYQGRKLSNFLMSCIHEHPVFSKVRRLMLFTLTAPWLYAKYGYEPVNQQNYAWTILRKDMYL
ncbi:GNAT family N-acetyltransferase [Rosenbergiella sp. S61]|uniref:GNAT family N-acetyltransferase n=1 Tax=Rosenbergiella gaditana TaxID=2726987 RepID=A0ABS5T092_9GAMM|nr:GNAT family N-acetyltransferase [Rosenbergiella gaditana]MBT0725744.1 GNAT family N-acetyltransferase [Rosenbergiella gaditana]